MANNEAKKKQLQELREKLRREKTIMEQDHAVLL